jgi:hypothetical protein
MDADKWFQLVTTNGLAVVFTAGFLGIFLYIGLAAVGIFKRWVPPLFESQIKMNEKVCEAVDELKAAVACTHDKVHSLHSGTSKIAEAGFMYAESNNLPKDVIGKLRDANYDLKQTSANSHHT